MLTTSSGINDFQFKNLNLNHFKFTAGGFSFLLTKPCVGQTGASGERSKCLDYLLFPGGFIAQ